MKKSLCRSCSLLITNNNIKRHEQICNGVPSLFVRHSQGLPVRAPRAPKDIDWQAFQSYYDDNHTYMETCRYFEVSSETASRAVKKGIFKTRSRATTARLRGKHIKGPHTEEEKQKTREGMRRAVLEGRQKTPRPYGKKCKLFEVINSLEEKEILQGGWEKLAADYMSLHNIRWTRSKKSFTYVYKEREHEYFPDFYLLDYDIYVEVKGMKTEKDDAKWSQFPQKLLVIDKTNIHELDCFFRDKKILISSSI